MLLLAEIAADVGLPTTRAGCRPQTKRTARARRPNHACSSNERGNSTCLDVPQQQSYPLGDPPIGAVGCRYPTRIRASAVQRRLSECVALRQPSA